MNKASKNLIFLVFLVIPKLGFASQDDRHSVLDLIPYCDISPLAVGLDNGEQLPLRWVLWPQAVEKDLVNKIVKIKDPLWLFNNGSIGVKQGEHQMLLLDKVIHNLKRDKRSLIWQDETKNVNDDLEPDYLKIISKQLLIKINKFSDKKIQDCQNRNDLIKHSYALIAASQILYTIGQDISKSALQNLDFDQKKSALKIFEASAWSESNQALGSIINERFIHMYSYFIKDVIATSWSSVHGPFIDIAEDDINISINQFIHSNTTNRNKAEIGMVSYRLAEKLALLHLLGDFHNLMDLVYESSLGTIEYLLCDDDFDLQNPRDFQDMKDSVYSSYSENSHHFLSPWFSEFSRIAGKIAAYE